MTSSAVVFVIDDEQVMRDALSLAFQVEQLTCRCYATADQFLDEYDRSQPGCLIVDLRLPGMTGLELVGNLEDEGIDLPVILVTGHGDEEIEAQAKRAGAIAVFKKPFRFEEMLKVTRDAIEGRLNRGKSKAN